MINAWDYAYDNYDGDNEDAVVDAIVEILADEIFDACDVNETIDAQEQYEPLAEAIREVVLRNINFNEIKKQMEGDREEYYEHRRSQRGEY